MLVKIQKTLDKKRGDKTYYRYFVRISNRIIDDLGWDDQSVKVSVSKGKVIIEKI